MHCVSVLVQHPDDRGINEQVAELEIRIAQPNGYAGLGINFFERVG